MRFLHFHFMLYRKHFCHNCITDFTPLWLFLTKWHHPLTALIKNVVDPCSNVISDRLGAPNKRFKWSGGSPVFCIPSPLSAARLTLFVGLRPLRLHRRGVCRRGDQEINQLRGRDFGSTHPGESSPSAEVP